MPDYDDFEKEAESLQTDVMRFIAIAAFALLIVFIPLIESIREKPQPSGSTTTVFLTSTTTMPVTSTTTTQKPTTPTTTTTTTPTTTTTTTTTVVPPSSSTTSTKVVVLPTTTSTILLPTTPPKTTTTPHTTTTSMTPPVGPASEKSAPAPTISHTTTSGAARAHDKPHMPRTDGISASPAQQQTEHDTNAAAPPSKTIVFEEGAFERLLGSGKIKGYVILPDHNLCFEIMYQEGRYAFTKASPQPSIYLIRLKQATVPEPLIRSFEKQLYSLAAYAREYYFEPLPSGRLKGELEGIIRGKEYGRFSISADERVTKIH